MSSTNEGCLLALLRIFGMTLPGHAQYEPVPDDGLDAEAVEELPYRVRDDFLSPAERHFYVALVAAIGEQAIVCPKVRLGDILFSTDRKQFWKHTNRVNQKHVDFLLCSRESVRPLVAIELDDTTHQQRGVQERDRFKDAAFRAAGLPLVRVPTSRTYDEQVIRSSIQGYLNPAIAAGPVPFASLAGATLPTCPKCGVPMVLRTASRGKQAGKQFFGCLHFPKCREMIQVGET